MSHGGRVGMNDEILLPMEEKSLSFIINWIIIMMTMSHGGRVGMNDGRLLPIEEKKAHYGI